MYLFLKIYKFLSYGFFLFSFLSTFFLFDLFICFCDDNLVDNENWFTDQEKEDFKVARGVFLNGLKIFIFLFSLLGFSFLAFFCILVFDIANAHNYKRPTD